MIAEVVTSFSNGYAYVKKHPQLLMTILLVIVIPFAFVFSGQQFLEAGRQNQDRLEKDRIGIMHDVFASFMGAVQFDPQRMQTEIEHIVFLNPDIRSFIIARDNQTDVEIIASNISETIGTKSENAMQYRITNANPNETLISPYAEDGVRYWRSYRLVRSAEGVTYYIFTETSLSHIDTLFANRITYAMYWLVGILLVVMYLIFRHVRLIDYAYLYQQTKHANEVKDMFTSMIAHELRAPLTAMRGYASMIRQREGVDKYSKEYAVRIEDASERLVIIVSDLLDVARIQSGKLSIQPTRTNIQPIVSAVLDTMRAQAREKNIELKKEGLFGDVIINVDGKRLHQALTNLVSNAIKYTAKGIISLEISDIGSVVEIRVKDTGMGISAENQKNLFAPFFRVKRTEVDAIVGTGLGMWITKQLIELMKGSVGVESIKGVGTHIVVVLPK